MSRLRAAVFALCFASPWAVAQAAEITRIASSFEEKDPFGMFIDVGFERTQERAKLVREFHQDGNVQDVNELRFVNIDTRLNLAAHIGLWQDFEISFGMPIVFAQDRRWRYVQTPEATDETNSSIYNNCVRPSGEIVPGCPGTTREPMFVINEDTNSFRGGLGNIHLGAAYAFFNQAKDETKPTWIVGLDYEAPTAELLDPTIVTASNARGKIGDRIHKYRFYTSLSRRLGAADPYFHVYYQLPVRGPGWYSNCDHAEDKYLGRPGNCGTAEWSRSETGIKPPHEAGLRFGSEFVVYERPATFQKVSFDARASVTYVGQGRYYNQMSDLFGRMLSTGDYVTLGGRVGFAAHLAEFIQLNVGIQMLYGTEHVLTDETIGKDLDPEGTMGHGTVDVNTKPIEINPTFDWRADMASRRFRATEINLLTFDATLTFAF